jgi:endonuclease YncB( thermonuclease family)
VTGKLRHRFALAFIAAVAAASPVVAQNTTTIPEIIDADTVYAGHVKIRLSGVDAPETDQVCVHRNGTSWACGLEAVNRLKEFSAGRAWVCKSNGSDLYNRQLSTCTVGGEDVSRWLVRNGWALAFVRYSTVYSPDEDYARQHKHGLWGSAFVAPWDWRQLSDDAKILGDMPVGGINPRRILIRSRSSPSVPGCLIKANLKRDGECIYHVPGGRFYERLQMNAKPSRRWFCTNIEAEGAGCRKSKL